MIKTREDPLWIQVLQNERAAFKQYFCWFAETKVKLPKDDVNVLRTYALVDLLEGEYAAVIPESFNPSLIPAEEDAVYFHLDNEESGCGRLSGDVLLGPCAANPELWSLRSDYCRNSDYVNICAVVVIDNKLMVEFIRYMADKGCKPNGTALPVWPDIPMPLGKEISTITSDCIVTGTQTSNSNKKEVPTMTQLQRRVVNITLMDNDEAILDAASALVKTWKDIPTQDDDATTIQELIMNKDVASAVKAHNTSRATMLDETILRNTGNKVMLRAVRLKDLTWRVTEA